MIGEKLDECLSRHILEGSPAIRYTPNGWRLVDAWLMFGSESEGVTLLVDPDGVIRYQGRDALIGFGIQLGICGETDAQE